MGDDQQQDAEVEEQGAKIRFRNEEGSEEQSAEEVEEQGVRPRFRDEDGAEVEEQGVRGRGREEGSEEQAADEVEEQGRKGIARDDEPPDPNDSEDNDGEVEEQRRISDASLKRSVAPIEAPLSLLG